MLAVEAQQTAFAETESKVFCNLCTELDIRHIRLCPYTPRTNSKAERFIQIASQGMAYAAPIRHPRNDVTRFQPASSLQLAPTSQESQGKSTHQ